MSGVVFAVVKSKRTAKILRIACVCKNLCTRVAGLNIERFSGLKATDALELFFFTPQPFMIVRVLFSLLSSGWVRAADANFFLARSL